MALEEDFELGEILLILVILLFVGWLIWKGFGSLADFLKNFKLPKLSDLFNFKTGGSVSGSGSGTKNCSRGCEASGTGSGKIKIELSQGACAPAVAAGGNPNCGGAQANCCTGNCVCN